MSLPPPFVLIGLTIGAAAVLLLNFGHGFWEYYALVGGFWGMLAGLVVDLIAQRIRTQQR